MIRVAATADVHVGADSRGRLGPHFEHVAEHADVLLIGGDLTKCGTADEARVLVDELSDVPIPRYAVLGNHDHHADEVEKVVAVLEGGGIHVLEGSHDVVRIADRTLGLAGVKGFGGGFPGAFASEFGESEMKAFVRHTKDVSVRLREALSALDTDVRVAVLHYSPVEETLRGERLELYPLLGSYLLGEAVDLAGADLVVHGHAHAGTERGVTAGGIRVRNVALPVIRQPYRVFEFGGAEAAASASV